MKPGNSGVVPVIATYQHRAVELLGMREWRVVVAHNRLKQGWAALMKEETVKIWTQACLRPRGSEIWMFGWFWGRLLIKRVEQI